MTKKIYLSRAQTRAMAFDHPIGDAFGGAPYGEKNDPMSVGYAAYSMYTAYEVGFAALTVWEGLAAVGGAMSLIGQVTGNSSLTKLGNIGMLAGGVGQLAQSAMADPSALKPEGGASMSGAEGNLAPVSDAVATPVVNGQLASATPTTPPVEAGPATNVTTGPTVSDLNVNQVGGPANGLNTPTSTTTPPPAGTTPPAGGVKPPVGDGSITGAIKEGLKSPMGMYAAATTVGSVADWLSGKTDAEIDALKAQTGYSNAKALETQAAIDKEKLRRANLNAGYTSVNAAIKTNPNAQVTRPWQAQQAAAPAAPAGLIAGARPA